MSCKKIVVCMAVMGLSLCGPATSSAQSALLILEFEFVEDMHDPRAASADQNRLRLANEELQKRMGSCAAVSLVDPAPAKAAIALARSRNLYVHRCNGCSGEIGAVAGAHYVLMPWVQKVSNLILNLNAEVRDAENDTVVAVRSVDLRGNTDRGWLRATRALANRLCDLDGKRFNRRPSR